MATYVTETGLKNTLQSFLNKLKEWLPFRKSTTSEGVDVVSFPSSIKENETFKNTMELHSDGKIFILGTNRDPIHLQESIESKGTTFVTDIDNLKSFLKEENKGRFFYLNGGDEEYPSGLYIIGTDASHGGVPILMRIGTTTGVTDLEARITLVEEWIEKPLSTDDIEILTDDDPTNDINVQ